MNNLWFTQPYESEVTVFETRTEIFVINLGKTFVDMTCRVYTFHFIFSSQITTIYNWSRITRILSVHLLHRYIQIYARRIHTYVLCTWNSYYVHILPGTNYWRLLYFVCGPILFYKYIHFLASLLYAVYQFSRDSKNNKVCLN